VAEPRPGAGAGPGEEPRPAPEPVPESAPAPDDASDNAARCRDPVLVVAPLTGTVVPLEGVPDPVFAQRMVGDGVAIEPADGRVVAPAAATVTALFPTGHAVGLRTNDGLELLIHVGIDSAHADGVFTTRVAVGDRVTAGQPLLEADLALLGTAARSSLSPVLVTNLGELGARVEVVASGRVEAGRTPLLHVRVVGR